MSFRAVSEHRFFRPAVGAALAALTGLALWQLPLGERWVNASYDYLFRFGARAVTNEVVLILMDNEAHDKLHQPREQVWDRTLHATLLEKLAADGCPLVVFDVIFDERRDPETDRRVAEAMRRCHRVVLAAAQAGAAHPGLATAHPTLPMELLLAAARTNWGVAWLDPELDKVVRRHWPFPSPGPYPSLSWTSARLWGANLDEVPQERWLRYYGVDGAWAGLSYDLALNKGPGYFHGKIVFVGNKPKTTLYDREDDEFLTPYARWTGEASGGVEILATSFLNLVNNDWLRRLAWPVEILLVVAGGIAMGGGLAFFRRGLAFGLALALALAVTIAGVCFSYFTNYWFPWLIVVGGQLPCAMAWALAPAKIRLQAQPVRDQTIVLSFPEEKLPDAPEFEILTPPIGEGGFGKVWIARNAIGQWQALKAVYQSKFGTNTKPYETEFHALQKYKPVSERHPGLLRIDLVSKMKSEGYFYYVMELGDAQAPGWEKDPASYKPRDLGNMRKQAEDRRLPAAECLRIGMVLADALDFLHRQGLTHRDIKPSNVIFVNGRPKLADIGLVTDIRPPELVNTWVGTAGYMPPPPEPPGTAQADIYALGMVLYVISTGRNPDFFPGLSSTLMDRSGHADFIRLNAVILKACQPDLAQRYQTTAEMLRALQEAQQAMA